MSGNQTIASTARSSRGSEGRMPKGILQGAQAKAVAQFVADNVEYIPGP